MKKTLMILLALVLSLGTFISATAQKKDMKVFISVDMEGVSGVIHGEDVSRSGKDYGLFRKLMTMETNATIEGALEMGATYVLVRDAHGSGRNILPDLLHSEADLIRDWSSGPLEMMEGIDENFDAVILIGYHARANTPDAVLDHTMTGAFYNVTLNGKPMPEAGINAFIAGNFGVPVVMVAGDEAICRQCLELFGKVVTAPVKQGVGNAARMLHPQKAQELIKKKTKEALANLKEYKPFRLTPPYTIEITYKNEERAEKASWIPGAKRSGNNSASFTSDDWMEILRFFLFTM
jgi:D-amino peptidase